MGKKIDLGEILNKYLTDWGLSLVEDDQYVYLKHGSDILNLWETEIADLGEIRKTALKWAAVYKKQGTKWQETMKLD